MARETSPPRTAAVLTATPGLASSSFDDRWEAWQGKGVISAAGRAMLDSWPIAAASLAIVAAAVFYTVVIR
jgi:hypothetical protein